MLAWVGVSCASRARGFVILDCVRIGMAVGRVPKTLCQRRILVILALVHLMLVHVWNLFLCCVERDHYGERRTQEHVSVWHWRSSFHSQRMVE